MKARLIGINNLNFKNQLGEVISGKNLYIAFEHPETVGLKCDKVFIKPEIEFSTDIKPNDLIELSFDYRGKCERVEKISK